MGLFSKRNKQKLKPRMLTRSEVSGLIDQRDRIRAEKALAIINGSALELQALEDEEAALNDRLWESLK